MASGYEPLIERLRQSAMPDRPVPAAAAPYVENVRRQARAVTDADVTELRQAGLSEDEVFEQTVSAAVAEGLRRLEAGLRVVE
jgi:alkylhydroperoxidase family enzyme